MGKGEGAIPSILSACDSALIENVRTRETLKLEARLFYLEECYNNTLNVLAHMGDTIYEQGWKVVRSYMLAIDELITAYLLGRC